MNIGRKEEMSSKLIALLAAAALAMPVIAADNAAVTIYGTLNVDFESVKADGGTTPLASRNRVSPNSANIGFRGSEDLGGGLKAFFQIESAVNVDAGGGTFASRNSNVGLSGAFGTLFFGNWDTLHKQSTGRFDPVATSIFDLTGAFGGATSCNSLSDKSANNSGLCFQRRQNNSVQYWSPFLGGFQGRLVYSANEARTSTLNPQLYDASLSYDVGPLYVTYIYSQHKDFDTVGEKATNNRLGVSYRFGSVTLGVVGEQIKADFPTATTFGSGATAATFAAGSQFKQNAYLVSFTYNFGASAIRLGYDFSNNRKVNGVKIPDSDAKQFSAQYAYGLSKRTEIYALYSKIINGSASQNTFATNPLLLTSYGQDPSGFGVGIKHSF
jgi:predicted porin